MEEVSSLVKKIKVQQDIIAREELIATSKGDTYICKRALTTLAGLEIKIQQLESEYNAKIAEYKEKIERSNKIILQERNTPSLTTIRARMEIEILQNKINALVG